jgi:hypothetical protein
MTKKERDSFFKKRRRGVIAEEIYKIHYMTLQQYVEHKRHHCPHIIVIAHLLTAFMIGIVAINIFFLLFLLVFVAVADLHLLIGDKGFYCKPLSLPVDTSGIEK